MKVELVGGPYDGRNMSFSGERDWIEVPVFKEYADGPLGLMPSYSVVTMPVHFDNNRVYWKERFAR